MVNPSVRFDDDVEWQVVENVKQTPDGLFVLRVRVLGWPGPARFKIRPPRRCRRFKVLAFASCAEGARQGGFEDVGAKCTRRTTSNRQDDECQVPKI